jgi:putative membrane protein
VQQEKDPSLDLRQHFALERTLLAYVRTGLALVGVGFVVARFGLLLREIGVRTGPAASPGLSLWFGTVLVFVGGFIGPLAWNSYLKQLSRLNSAMGVREKPAAVAVILSVILSLVGIAMAVYLIATRP